MWCKVCGFCVFFCPREKPPAGMLNQFKPLYNNGSRWFLFVEPWNRFLYILYLLLYFGGKKMLSDQYFWLLKLHAECESKTWQMVLWLNSFISFFYWLVLFHLLFFKENIRSKFNACESWAPIRLTSFAWFRAIISPIPPAEPRKSFLICVAAFWTICVCCNSINLFHFDNPANYVINPDEAILCLCL